MSLYYDSDHFYPPGRLVGSEAVWYNLTNSQEEPAAKRGIFYEKEKGTNFVIDSLGNRYGMRV